MIRLTIEHSRLLLLLTHYVRRVSGRTTRDVIQALMDHCERAMAPTHPDRRLLENMSVGVNVREDLADVSEAIGNQLVTIGNKGLHGDLIDRLAGVLKGPFANNVLSGQTLNILRKEILLPSEAGAIKALKDKEMSCGRCGSVLTEGEMVSLIAGSVWCFRCYRPTSVACTKPGCKEHAAIGNQLSKMSSKGTDCGRHSEKSEAEKPVTVAADPTWIEMARQAANQPIRRQPPINRILRERERERQAMDALNAVTNRPVNIDWGAAGIQANMPQMEFAQAARIIADDTEEDV